MTNTPWGEANRLRSRKLSPGPGPAPELKVRNQRERLMGAAIATFADKGYEATRVADILTIAGVSRHTFYQHFANKHDCFMATMHGMMKLAGRVMLDSYQQTSGPWQDRLEAMLQLLVDLVVAQPAAFRMALIEVHSAGPDALDLLEEMSDGVERAVMEILRDAPEQAGLPRAAVRGLLNGTRSMIARRLRENREHELSEMVPGVIEWSLSYKTPAVPLKSPDELEPYPVTVRAPSTDTRDRIIKAIVDLVAEHGYTGLKISAVAERAAVSLTTFYGHFGGKEEAFLATLADSQERLLVATLPAYLSTDDWPRAVSAASRAFTGYLSTDPTVAKLGSVDVWATGDAVLAQRAQGLGYFANLLDEGYRRSPDTPAIVREAVTSAIDALLFDQVRRAGAERLYEVAPVGAFLALAPFIGSDEAAEIANEDPPPPRDASAPAAVERR